MVGAGEVFILGTTHGTILILTDGTLHGDMDTVDIMIHLCMEPTILLGDIVDGIHHFIAAGTVLGDMVAFMVADTMVVDITVVDMVTDTEVVSMMDITQD